MARAGTEVRLQMVRTGDQRTLRLSRGRTLQHRNRMGRDPRRPPVGMRKHVAGRPRSQC